MEAALRSAYYLVNKTNPEPDAFQCVRGLDGWKEAKFTINGNILKVAVASSLSNASLWKLLQQARHIMTLLKLWLVLVDVLMVVDSLLKMMITK